jgi:hypothetical protein
MKGGADYWIEVTWSKIMKPIIGGILNSSAGLLGLLGISNQDQQSQLQKA